MFDIYKTKKNRHKGTDIINIKNIKHVYIEDLLSQKKNTLTKIDNNL